MSHTSVHLVQKSPFTSTALASCLRVCAPTDVIVLMHDAVYGATQAREWPCARVYAMADDIAARGIADRLTGGVTAIDYSDLVELCSQHRHSQSWF